MNPVTVRIFNINQDRVVTKFLDMCLSKASTAASIFASIVNVFQVNKISSEKCLSLVADNTSAIVGKKNENIILMECRCHIAHNTTKKATGAFCQLSNFNIEEILVNIYYHFDYSSKRKNLLADFCEFCDQEYCKILKFHSVRWLGTTRCLERLLRLFPSLRSYFLSQNESITDGERSQS